MQEGAVQTEILSPGDYRVKRSTSLGIYEVEVDTEGCNPFFTTIPGGQNFRVLDTPADGLVITMAGEFPAVLIEYDRILYKAVISDVKALCELVPQQTQVSEP